MKSFEGPRPNRSKGDRYEFHHGTKRPGRGGPGPAHGLQHVRHVRGALPDGSDRRGRSSRLDTGQSARRGDRRQPLREGRCRPGLRARRPAAADAAHPQGPARRRPVAAGVLGRGPRLHRRQAEGDDRGFRPARHRAFRSRRTLRRPDEDLRAGARLAELLQPRRLLQRERSQCRALDLRLRLRRARLRPEEHEAPRALRPQHRRIAHGQGGKGLHGRRGERDARHLHRSARHHHGLQGHSLLASAPQQRLRVEPRHHPRSAEARGLRQGLRRALRHGHGLPARGGRGHDARMAGEPYRRSRRGAPGLREGDRRRETARDLPSGLDERAPQAVVPRQPQRADPECPDGQHRDSGRLRDRQAARVLRPQEPEAAERARAQGRRAARGRCRHHPALLGPGDRHAAPGVRRHGDRASPTASAPTSPTATIHSPGCPMPRR